MLRVSLAIMAFLLAWPVAQALDLPRTALWSVVQICVANAKATGAAFPCLQVDLQDGTAALEAPFESRDIILMPTRKVSGIEDRALLAPDAPDYFALAWKARRFVDRKVGHAMPRDRVGLAVNSTMTRSQDQFHIHIDCIATSVAARLKDIASGLEPGRWRRSTVSLRGQNYWARSIAADDLDAAHVMQLVAHSPAAKHATLAPLTVAVLGATLQRKQPGFILLVADTQISAASTAEDLLDHACS
jgi:CDP-diacylglycerol pyrophosphatase